MFASVVLPSAPQGRRIAHGESRECSVNVLGAAFTPPQGTGTTPQDLSGNRGPRSSRICSGPVAAVVRAGARLPEGSRATWAHGPSEAGECRASSS